MTSAFFPARTLLFLALCVFALAAHGGETYSQIMDDGRGYSGSSRWLVYAALHLIPIVIVAFAFNSYFLTIVTALVVGWVAVSVGSASYAAVDVIFVLLGLFVAVSWHWHGNSPPDVYRRKRVEEPPPSTEPDKGSSMEWVWWIVGGGLMVFFFIYLPTLSKRTVVPLAPPAHQTAIPPAQPSSPPLPPSSAPKSTSVQPSKRQGDMRHCLDLKTSAEIARCAR